VWTIPAHERTVLDIVLWYGMSCCDQWNCNYFTTRSEYGNTPSEYGIVRSEYGNAHSEYGIVRSEYGKTRSEYGTYKIPIIK